MSLRLLPLSAGVATVVFLLSWGMNVPAAPSGKAAEERTEYLDPNGDYSSLTDPEALRLAYQILSQGNHNYNGHRIAAMNEIREAARLLGVELKGDGADRESQEISDARFHLAQRLLQQVRSKQTGETQKPVLKRVDQALSQIAVALKIRAVEKEQQQDATPRGNK